MVEKSRYCQYHLNEHIFTARKRSLRRLCFYTGLSVILFTGGCLGPCPGVGVLPGGRGGLGPCPVAGGLPRAGVQAQTQEGPRPRQGGVYPSMHWGRHPPPQQMATAADGTHPTGMHSCFKKKAWSRFVLNSAKWREVPRKLPVKCQT